MNDLTNVVPIQISKLDAARRQLVIAIRLYFANTDPVSTHTLAAASLGILGDLDKHGPNTGTMFDHIERYVIPDQIPTVRKALRKAQNFFKHADEDPESVLEYYPTNPVAVLWAATEKYNELAKEDILETAALRTWVIIRNPGILLSPYREQVEGLKLGKDFSPEMRSQYFEAFSTAYARGFAQQFRSSS